MTEKDFVIYLFVAAMIPLSFMLFMSIKDKILGKKPKKRRKQRK